MSRSLLSLDFIIHTDGTPLNPPMALGLRVRDWNTSRARTGAIVPCRQGHGMELHAAIAAAASHQ